MLRSDAECCTHSTSYNALLSTQWPLLTETLRHAPVPLVRAQASLLHRITKAYPKPAFGLVAEEVVITRPFCRLIHFATVARRAAARAGRRTAVGSSRDARARHGRDAARRSRRLRHRLDRRARGPARARQRSRSTTTSPSCARSSAISIRSALHVVAVCQPTVPALAAVALSAAAGEAHTALADADGRTDRRARATRPSSTSSRPIIRSRGSKRNMIHRVPERLRGRGPPRLSRLPAALRVRDDEPRQARAARTGRTGSINCAATPPASRCTRSSTTSTTPCSTWTRRTTSTPCASCSRSSRSRAARGASAASSSSRRRSPRRRCSRSRASSTISPGLGQTEAAHELCPNAPAQARISSPRAAVTTACSPDRAGAIRSIPRFAPSSERHA